VPPGTEVGGAVTPRTVLVDVPSDLVLMGACDGLDYPWKGHGKSVPNLEDSSGPKRLTKS
jgi:hypothetical protein